MHGHPPGEDAPRGAVVRRCGTVEDLGVTRGARQMNILVTGHSGYIGTVLTQMLLRAGHSVVGLDMGLYAKCTFGSDPAAPVPCINSAHRKSVVEGKGVQYV